MTNELTRSFVSFLVDKKREGELHMVATNFIASYKEMKGIARATVISAMPMNEATHGKNEKVCGDFDW